MKTNFKKSTWIMIGAAAAMVLIALIVVINVNSGLKYMDFFYPDSQYQKLNRESRAIRVKDKNGTPLETKIIKEYILGPVHYNQKLTIRDDITVLNVWGVKNRTLYVNFNGGFGKYLQDNAKDATWMIRGLGETLRVNTPYENMVILVNDNQIHDTIGEYKLSNPVRIRNPRR